ncbi:hypothetical protein JRO89_XS03G0127500 [Xanthoceras sorbifolium]|uniref:Uncharacterized protein n=1 Tax=Xanthoceras sorbifolium TaxID=99658 RepID=A0ABQ8IA02_9ROSI|nr:hypothetical protein JRO89_XS03G0127500 [Xanthoceras sorbifolium]
MSWRPLSSLIVSDSSKHQHITIYWTTKMRFRLDFVSLFTQLWNMEQFEQTLELDRLASTEASDNGVDNLVVNVITMKRQFRTETLIDYDDLKVVIGNATSSGRYSIGLGDDTNARVIGVKDRHVGIEDYVFDENNNVFVQSEHKPSHQALPLEQSMSPLSFQNMGSEIPSKSTNSRREAKVIMKGLAYLRAQTKLLLLKNFLKSLIQLP